MYVQFNRMKYETPFYVHGLIVSVHHGETVRVYLKNIDEADKYEKQIDRVMQYLMDEQFVTVDRCKIEIYCKN